MRHLCPTCFSAFQYLPKSEWKRCWDEQCGDCAAEGTESFRFKKDGDSVVPAKWCLYFGVEDTLQELLMDQQFVDAVHMMKRKEDPYYKSDEAMRLFAAAKKVWCSQGTNACSGLPSPTAPAPQHVHAGGARMLQGMTTGMQACKCMVPSTQPAIRPVDAPALARAVSRHAACVRSSAVHPPRIWVPI